MKISLKTNHPCFDSPSLAIAYEVVNDKKWFERYKCFYIDEYLENLKDDKMSCENDNLFKITDTINFDDTEIIAFKDKYNKTWYTCRFSIVGE